MQLGRGAAEVMKEPLSGVAQDLQDSFRRRSAQVLGEGVIAGLKASRDVIVPALRLLGRLPKAVDAAARMIAEGDGEDFSILSEAAKQRYRDIALAAARGFEKFFDS